MSFTLASNINNNYSDVSNDIVNDLPSHVLQSQQQNNQQQHIQNDKLDRNLFTFKPKLNPKSEQLTQNIEGFHERQNKHLKKQLDLVSLLICFSAVLKM